LGKGRISVGRWQCRVRAKLVQVTSVLQLKSVLEEMVPGSEDSSLRVYSFGVYEHLFYPPVPADKTCKER
jgi:hypothetical protein